MAEFDNIFKIAELEDELASTYDKLEKAKADIERLNKELDELAEEYSDCQKTNGRD